MKASFIIGFAETIEDKPGVFSERITEKVYIGELFKQSLNSLKSPEAHPGLSLSYKFGFIADNFARLNITKIRYVIVFNEKWTVSSFGFEDGKKIILSFGGMYNENT